MSVGHGADTRRRLAWVYAAALEQVGSMPGNAAHDPTSTRRLRRIMWELVELSDQAPTAFLTLAVVRGAAEPSAEHGVAVAVLAMAFGRRAGLPAKARVELGLLALRHAAEHTFQGGVAGVPVALRIVGDLAGAGRFDEETLRAFLVRQDWDARGNARAYARLLCIASALDGQTRPGRQEDAVELHEAVRKLINDKQGRFDRPLLEEFLNMLGLDFRKAQVKGAPLGALKLKRLAVPG